MEKLGRIKSKIIGKTVFFVRREKRDENSSPRHIFSNLLNWKILEIKRFECHVQLYTVDDSSRLKPRMSLLSDRFPLGLSSFNLFRTIKNANTILFCARMLLVKRKSLLLLAVSYDAH